MLKHIKSSSHVSVTIISIRVTLYIICISYLQVIQTACEDSRVGSKYHWASYILHFSYYTSVSIVPVSLEVTKKALAPV